jgi:phage gpG-like protein
VGIRGDFAGLRKMKIQIADIGSESSRAALSKVMMHEALELVDEGFATSTAPDGSGWKKLALRNGQPLRDTRRLQSSFTGTSNSRGFKIGTNVMYAATHQDGKTIKAKGSGRLHFNAGGRHFSLKQVKIPARPMVPEGSALPPRWRNALNDAAREYVARKLRR